MSPSITIRTSHGRPAVVAEALRPDNTEQMSTAVDDGAVLTAIERPSDDGLRATADDYLRNVRVAEDALRAVGPDR